MEFASLDGTGNNRRHPDFGVAGATYLRVAPANYADGRSEPVDGPDARFISNRDFNDVGQNVFSENQVTQWGYDTFGRVTTKTNAADTEILRYSYHLNGALSNRWSAAKTNTVYSYDAAMRSHTSCRACCLNAKSQF